MTRNIDTYTFNVRVSENIAYLEALDASMLTISTPAGDVELNSAEMLWLPKRGISTRVEIGEDIVNSCICHGPQGSVGGILLFGSEGFVMFLRLPALTLIQSLRLERTPDAVQVVYHEGHGHLVVAEQGSMNVRPLNALERIVSVIECERKVELFHLDGSRLIAVHGFEISVMDIEDIIPPQQPHSAKEFSE